MEISRTGVRDASGAHEEADLLDIYARVEEIQNQRTEEQSSSDAGTDEENGDPTIEYGAQRLGRDDFNDFLREHPEIQDVQTSREAYAFESIEAMQQEIIDAEEYSRAAETLINIMRAFVDRGEDFQPTAKPELREWLRDVLNRKCPGLDEDDREYLLDQVKDFPPVTQKPAESE